MKNKISCLILFVLLITVPFSFGYQKLKWKGKVEEERKKHRSSNIKMYIPKYHTPVRRLLVDDENTYSCRHGREKVGKIFSMYLILREHFILKSLWSTHL